MTRTPILTRTGGKSPGLDILHELGWKIWQLAAFLECSQSTAYNLCQLESVEEWPMVKWRKLRDFAIDEGIRRHKDREKGFVEPQPITSDELKAWRSFTGMTVVKMATFLEISCSLLEQYLYGRIKPPIDRSIEIRTRFQTLTGLRTPQQSGRCSYCGRGPDRVPDLGDGRKPDPLVPPEG